MAKTSKPVAPPAPQPPYIKRAHLRNVPPLRDVKVDFKPGLNIIIGKNGSGKTNFMKLLSELAESDKDKYKGGGCELLLVTANQGLNILFKDVNVRERKGVKKKSIRAMNGNLPLVAIVDSGIGKVENEQLTYAFDALAAKSESDPWDFDYVVISIWHGLPNYRLPIVDESADMTLPYDERLDLTSFTGLKWEINSELVKALLSNIEGEDLFSEIDLDENVSSDDIAETRYRIARVVDAHLERLNPYLVAYSPLQGVRCGEQFQVYFSSTQDELLIKGLVLEYMIGGDWLPFSALSDGTKRIFYLISEFVSTPLINLVGSTSRFLKPKKIIFLEEPELGIHPDQLQLLLQLIREVSNEHQVIMTTHSPQTLDMLSAQELDRITICEFIPGKGTQMRKLSAAKKNKAKAYLRDSGFLSEFWRFSNLEDPD